MNKSRLVGAILVLISFVGMPTLLVHVDEGFLAAFFSMPAILVLAYLVFGLPLQLMVDELTLEDLRNIIVNFFKE